MCVGLLTLAFLARCLLLDLALPYGDPFDEPYHYAYAAFLAETGHPPTAAEPSLPVDALRPFGLLPASEHSRPSSPGWRQFAEMNGATREGRRTAAFAYSAQERRSFADPNYEAQQPPLFYFFPAGILRLLPLAPLNLRLLYLRVFATLCAVLAIPLSYRFFRMTLTRPAAISATAALVALPGVSSLVARFTNDAQAFAVAAGLLILLVEISRGRLGWQGAACLAGVLAAGCWTKLSLLPLLPSPLLAAVPAPRDRRRAMLGRSVAACVAAILLVSPWFIRQHRDTGDWLGLMPTKQASFFRVGLLARLSALPDLLHWKYPITMVRTFLWPGTHSAMGAPAALALLLAAAILALWTVPALTRPAVPGRVRRQGLVALIPLVLFLIAEISLSATSAAVARSRGGASLQLGTGWYAAILTSAVLVVGCVFGARPSRNYFQILALLALAATWCIDLGVLPGVYSGRRGFNGANAPFSEYGRWIFSPSGAFRTYDLVALVDTAPWLLALLWLVWQAALVAALWLATRKRSRAA